MSKFNLSHMHNTTLDAGYLVPVCTIPTLPGDKFRISLDAFIRCRPMTAPLMHKVKFVLQYWYVPYRIIWEDFPDFITGGENLSATPAFPYIKAPASTADLNGGFEVGSIFDYFGFPVNKPEIEVSAMPSRALALIWNTRYRDEDLQAEVPISFASGLDTTTNTMILSPSWKRDYFTVARGRTQRGNQISVPIQLDETGTETRYPAITSKVDGSIQLTFSSFDDSTSYQLVGYRNLSITSMTFDTTTGAVSGSAFVQINLKNPFSNIWRDKNLTFTGNVGSGFQYSTLPTQLTPYVATGFSVPGGGAPDSGSSKASMKITVGYVAGQSIFPLSGTTVNTTSGFEVRDLRLASSLQRYAENSLKWGNRYEEFIMREFGIKPRDSRIQRPEYLGGSQSILQISEVLQTAEGTDTGVGTMRGHGVASLRQRRIRFTSPEHGVILGLLSIRPEPVYTDGIEREWLKRSRLDFYTPELANIGMQEIFQQEIYATKDNKDVPFGFTDRYQEYRYIAPKVTGEFRTEAYKDWTMSREFSAPPSINGSFISMSSSMDAFKRPFVSKNEHSYIAMLRNNIIAYRRVPKRAKNILK